ncbi:MAG TPA: hypothetical protein VJR70_06895 [Stellaceae bacterium]|nr:hypothetical protein [Stellaceae bacterium]
MFIATNIPAMNAITMNEKTKIGREERGTLSGEPAASAGRAIDRPLSSVSTIMLSAPADRERTGSAASGSARYLGRRHR